MTTRACDGCFTRKIKCVQPATADAAASPRAWRLTRCQPCQDILMDCTYDRPQQRRPRRSKATSSVISACISTPIDVPEPVAGSSDVETPYTAITVEQDNGSPFTLPDTTRSESLHSEPTSVQPTHAPLFGLPRVGTRQVFDLMIRDYLNLLYPLVPLVHRPTFEVDVATDRADTDPLFYSQLLCIFAYVVATLPRRFLDYQKAQWLFGFRTPEDLVKHLEEAVLKLRAYDYFETPTTQKCIIAYFLGVTFVSLGVEGRMTMYFAELWMFLKAIGAHNPNSYASLDFVEAQLLKKVFWLYAIVAVHERVGVAHLDTRLWNPLPDQMLFDSKHFEYLLPLILDDEYILPDRIFQQPSPETSLTAGFINLVRIYACMIDFPVEKSGFDVRVDAVGSQNQGEVWIRRSHSQYEVVRRMFDRVRYVLDDLPPPLAAWQSDSADKSAVHESGDKASQLESMRANLHVTRLWARSLLFERLIALDGDEPAPRLFMDERSRWAERENSCEQLLHLLYNIKQTNLEPNGISLTFKIRQVAAPLLDCSFEDHTCISRRARRYIEQFMELLTLLDQYSFQDTQMIVWRDFERQNRQPASEFKDTPGSDPFGVC